VVVWHALGAVGVAYWGQLPGFGTDYEVPADALVLDALVGGWRRHFGAVA